MPGLKERLQAVAEGKAEPPPIAKTLGMKLTKVDEGKATMTMAVDEKFHNPMGTLHGGILTDLADATMGIALISTLAEGESFTTLELKMNFLRSMVVGKITAEGTVVHRGRTIALVESIVKDERGKLVARGVATQMVLRRELRDDGRAASR